MNNLPRELALDIFSRLPLSSLLQAKYVCRSWRSLAQDPLLVPLQFARSPNNKPYLILHTDYPLQNHLHSLHFSSNDHTKLELVTRSHVPKCPEFVVIGSCNGLLCLWDSLYHDEGFLHNPFTRQTLWLPKPQQFMTQQRVSLGFGFDSEDKVYKVVKVVYYKNGDDSANPLVRRFSLPKSEVQILTIQNDVTSTWKSKGETAYQLEGKPSEVIVNGRVHWLSHRRGHQARCILVSFDISDEKFRQVPSPDDKRFAIFCYHLVNLRGCLSAVVRGYASLYIWTMKHYGVKESWVEEFNINCDQFPLKWPQARVLWVLENGEILLEYQRKGLVFYNPKSQMSKELVRRGLPERFNAFVHVGSLNWIGTKLINM